VPVSGYWLSGQTLSSPSLSLDLQILCLFRAKCAERTESEDLLFYAGASMLASFGKTHESTLQRRVADESNLLYNSTGTSSERHIYQLAMEQYGCQPLASRSMVRGLGITFIP
jgi:hypothetical protein